MAQNEVKYIVYTSMVQARPSAIFHGTATHNRTEELIKKTKIPYTFFRNSMYLEAIPELIGNALQTGEIRYPSGNGKLSFVSRADIAEALANVLTENTHKNQIYEITGSSAWTIDELAQIISAEKKINIKHIDISETSFRVELISFQLPLPVVDLLVSMANAIKVGEFSHSENTLENLLGRKSLSLRAFLRQSL